MVVEELVSRNLTFDKPIMTSKGEEARNLSQYLKIIYQELKSARKRVPEKKKKEDEMMMLLFFRIVAPSFRDVFLRFRLWPRFDYDVLVLQGTCRDDNSPVLQVLEDDAE